MRLRIAQTADRVQGEARELGRPGRQRRGPCVLEEKC